MLSMILRSSKCLIETLQNFSKQSCEHSVFHISNASLFTSSASKDLREFIDWSYHHGGEPEAHGRAWQREELRLKGWNDLHKLWHLCCKERNLLLTEMGWRGIPKDHDEQMLMGMPRGSPKEDDVHRLRYVEVKKTLKRIKTVLRERVIHEVDPMKREQMVTVIMAK
ncbi:hypothetical protein CEUSTIGMA_g6426.t1 [Chlamydomonas eustigma]|uniref:Large ribosomal subunit protein uL29m n=1 Tax=Chlamydomonas eustigma TaxID=1157962 RepID=A0A250X7F9_9CHLO|nr:hypothetical protein CEUSTIGMA_g6426.t1 [Chlamydomonas eustigma]|eukprot:GAX78986.1 hypothetical protein CEUSTIGMA_g6426.t1 [Chlamydomonas eustigma]